jgi:SAM-dependent methyltransferase
VKAVPGALEKLSILANEYAMFGLREAAQHALVYLLTRWQDDFDRKYGVATSLDKRSPLEEISDPTVRKNASDYLPIREVVLRHILKYVQEQLEPTALTFVDLGCGKGRALLVAAELPFIEVIGVEISPTLQKVAERNIATYLRGPKRQSVGKGPHLQARTNIQTYCSDATRFEYPDTDLIVYLFCPFRGEVLKSVLDQLATVRRTTRRNVYVILCGRITSRTIHDHPSFVKRHEVRVISSLYSWNLWECIARDQVASTAASQSAPAREGAPNGESLGLDKIARAPEVASA